MRNGEGIRRESSNVVSNKINMTRIFRLSNESNEKHTAVTMANKAQNSSMNKNKRYLSMNCEFSKVPGMFSNFI